MKLAGHRVWRLSGNYFEPWAVSPDEDRAVCFISPSRVCVLNFCNLKCALPADFFSAQRKGRISTAETSLLPVGKIPSTSNVPASRLENDQHGGFRSPDLEEQYLLTPEDLLYSDESDDSVDYDDSDWTILHTIEMLNVQNAHALWFSRTCSPV